MSRKVEHSRVNRYQLLGPEASEFVRELIPPWLLPVLGVVTELGNPAVLMAVFVLDYWFGDHRRGAHAFGVAVAGFALVTALKTYFVAPRPPTEVNVIPASGYSFPSGHATAAAVGYGILAYDGEAGEWWQRYGLAGVIVFVVALSRVDLGVHYVGDVVAGVAVGVAFVALAVAATRHDPLRAFVLALAVSVAAVVLSGAGQDSIVTLGVAIGAVLAWPVLQPVPEVQRARNRAVLAVLLLPLVIGVGYLSTLEVTGSVLTFGLSVLLGAAVLAIPEAASFYEARRRDAPESSDASA
jgi:membrane-associated phospholipid phosphatase